MWVESYQVGKPVRRRLQLVIHFLAESILSRLIRIWVLKKRVVDASAESRFDLPRTVMLTVRSGG